MSKTFCKKIDKKTMSVFPRFVLFYRFLGGFLAMGLQKHYKKRCAKKSREKFLQKIDKKSKPIFLGFF
jgi:hypothetical protein